MRTLLGCLLFQRDAVRKQVGSLSGGEKVRLALTKILLSEPGLLVLDEPTNGLDLLSRERVEGALEQYPGTYAEFLRRGERKQPARGEDTAGQRLLLESRLAQLSAQLAAPPEGEAERLTAVIIRVSRELRAMKR